MNDEFLENVFDPIKLLFLSVTENLLDRFSDHRFSSLIFFIIIIGLLFVGVVGIKKKNTSVIILLTLLSPVFVAGWLEKFKNWNAYFETNILKEFMDVFVKIFTSMDKNICPTMCAVFVFCLVANSIVPHLSTFFHIILLSYYYNYIIYPQAGNAYFSPSSFFSIMVTLPFVILYFCVDAASLFIASFIFSLASVWSVLSILLRNNQYISKDSLESILDDFFSINLYRKSDESMCFIMAISLCIFIQYCLQIGRQKINLNARSNLKNNGFNQ